MSFDQAWSSIPNGELSPGGMKSAAGTKISFEQAIVANAAEVGRLMDALYAQTLPARLGADETATLPEPDGVRNAVALPGGAYVSRVGGEGVTLGFRHMLLKADD